MLAPNVIVIEWFILAAYIQTQQAITDLTMQAHATNRDLCKKYQWNMQLYDNP
jgi:hypothetical protein